jgi:hypothetical protein
MKIQKRNENRKQLLENKKRKALVRSQEEPSAIASQTQIYRHGHRYPFNYLEMIDAVFGKEDNTIEVCS